MDLLTRHVYLRETTSAFIFRTFFCYFFGFNFFFYKFRPRVILTYAVFDKLLPKVPSVMCDRNVPTKLKDKVYKTAIKPAMVYGAECWAVGKKEERKLHATEMRMLRWARGKTRLDHVRNVDIWKEARMYPMAEFLREKRLRWFGHNNYAKAR